MEFTAEWAQNEDRNDDLSALRKTFLIPEKKGEELVYFTGNSLGLQPKKAAKYIEQELADWGNLGVEGHVKAKRPWMSYHEQFAPLFAPIVGALESEVVAMNSLTANLHLLMVSFYRPTEKRRKIVCEKKAFPSDIYALQSQISFHGGNPETDLIQLQARPGETFLRTEDILEVIEENKNEIAMLMIGGVNYYTGQWFDMKTITEKASALGIVVGWDLAHAAGNVPLQLHDWGVDFAAWCSYKYLNGGPGAISGAFVHEKHHANKNLPRFAGWWGHDKESRFTMPDSFQPIQSAEAWQLSNPPILAMTPLLASLELFEKAGGINKLREKSLRLTDYLAFVVEEVCARNGFSIRILTPENKNARGCQLSLVFTESGKDIFDDLMKQGVIADWREPDVIRIAPVPLYNSFSDIYRFGIYLEKSMKKVVKR